MDRILVVTIDELDDFVKLVKLFNTVVFLEQGDINDRLFIFAAHSHFPAVYECFAKQEKWAPALQESALVFRATYTLEGSDE